jgi:hypothetical protein
MAANRQTIAVYAGHDMTDPTRQSDLYTVVGCRAR